MSDLNEGSVPDLAVQCLDVWGQVHVQQEVVLEDTPDRQTPNHLMCLCATYSQNLSTILIS